MNERVKRLREKSLKAVPYISIERALVVDQVYRENEGSVPIPVLRALVFKKLMEEKKLVIADEELVVGERGEQAAATPTYPELCCHTLEDFQIMNDREKISYKVSQEVRNIHKEQIIPYWKKRSMRQRILDAMSDEWRDCYYAGIFTEFMEQRGPGHTVADHKIFQLGFKDFKQQIEDARSSLDFFNDSEAFDRKAQLDAMEICCDAIIAYGKRYAVLAREMAAETECEQRKQELLEIAETCEWVPENAPRTFAEAVQMYWFVHIGVITEMNNWDSFNPGHLDHHLNPFYQKEVADGSLSREDAKEILQCLWVKFNNQPAPPKVGVTLKESGTYTDFANINSGGLKDDGSDGVNDVSYLVLEVIDEMQLLQPSSNVQISKKTPHDFLLKACDVARKGWGQPSFFNADAVVEELLRQGKDIVDARQGGTSGCVETGAFGKESYILTGYFNLPKILELTLHDGLDPRTGKQLGPKTGKAEDFASYDELFEAFNKQMDYFLDIKIHGNNQIEWLYARYMPVPFLSVVIDDCISKGKDYNAGGARYNTMYIQGVGIGDITDSLTVLKKHVFEEKTFTMAELMAAVDRNFEDHERLYNIVANHTPKYGNDEDYPDALMVEAFNAFLRAVDGRPCVKGGSYRINMLPTTCHVYFGSVMIASPNGRRSGQPLPEGISPSKGADVKGPTAVVRSAAKMDHLSTGGTLLNQKFTPKVLEGENGLENVGALVRSYFRMDGHHIQFNVITRETLQDAQKNPDKYKGLIVRVAGYSDYFANLDKILQDEIIARTEQDFSSC